MQVRFRFHLGFVAAHKIDNFTNFSTDAYGCYNVFFMDDRFRRTVPNDGVFPLARFSPGMKVCKPCESLNTARFV